MRKPLTAIHTTEFKWFGENSKLNLYFNKSKQNTSSNSPPNLHFLFTPLISACSWMFWSFRISRPLYHISFKATKSRMDFAGLRVPSLRAPSHNKMETNMNDTKSQGSYIFHFTIWRAVRMTPLTLWLTLQWDWERLNAFLSLFACKQI